MKALTLSFLIFFTAALCSYTVNTIGSPEVMPSTSARDADFLKTVYNTNIFEISAAKLVSQRTQNQKIKDFATRMIKDHTDILSTTKSVAEKLEVILPGRQTDQAMIDDLSKLKVMTGKDFEREYVDINAKGHKKCLSMFETVMSDNSYSAEVKQMVSESLSMIREHSKIADELQNLNN